MLKAERIDAFMEARLEAVKRAGSGKSMARQMRRDGRVPAVLYGGGPRDGKAPEAIPISVDPKAISRILHSDSGANTLIALRLDDVDTRVMIKEYQLDPVSHQILHADFYRVAMDKMIQVSVPVVVKGEPRGVKQQGGLLDFVHREIDIECLPGDIPEHLELDVTELMLGQSIRLRDVVLSAQWRPVSDPDIMLVHVIAPKAVEAPAPEAAAAVAPAAPAEPEVIKKGKAEKPEEEE
jgi:large subunit ribosomal protein L25